ncbi:uncharacterized protein B0H64DRAFT_43686 [Chaetomium fimeti]|uniref:Uncharacterized protein n=1 Tax=Chaetomium fimeti TaxID=1854472 RepID=A0AAE0LNA2_9PEZI|nr:hypothetical protein B0H64DRAFT_43686 [Chaetomium fimeti]
MRYSWAWITGFAILSLTANIVFLIGCISPATKDICLYRVNVTLLADGLHNLALVDSGNETDLLVPPELPTYWYWGMAGICDVFEKTGETRCRRAFPPTQNLLGILEGSLTDRLGDDEGQRVGNILSSWNATLHKISPDRLVAKEAKFAAQSKASAALAILAIILDAATPLLASFLLSDQSRRRAYIAPLLSALIAMAAGTLATLTMRDGVHGIVDTPEHGGPAIIIVFVGAALRLLSCVGACGGSRNKLRMTRNEKIGFRGEQHV